MANYYGVGRSNYITIPKENKAIADFLAGAEWVAGEDQKYALLAGSDSGYVSDYLDGGSILYEIEELPEGQQPELIAYFKKLTRSKDLEALEDVEELEIDLELMATLVHPEEAFIFMTSGAEKLRYVSGTSELYVGGKLIHSIDLDDIYAVAKEHTGVNPTTATY